MGADVLGRNWVCLADGRSYWAGDLTGDSSGTVAYNFRDAVLKGSENIRLNGGGTFPIPGSPPDIRSIIGTAQLDTSLGQGAVAIGTPYGFFSNQAPFDRTTWSNVTTPLQSISLISYGPVGQDSTVGANGDTMFRAPDGVRSLIMGRRDFDVWGNVPQSIEVSPVLNADNRALLPWASAVVFDNRMLLTASPIQVANGVYHTQFVVLNFDPLSSIAGKDPSVWEGTWTPPAGVTILKVVKGTFQSVERAFIFSLNLTTNNIELWEINYDPSFTPPVSVSQDNQTVPVTWEFVSPNMFQEADVRERVFKAMEDSELSVEDLIGSVTFAAYYKPDQYPAWVPWFKWTETAIPGVTPNYRPRMGLGRPATTPLGDASTGRQLNAGYTFQMRLVVTGYCIIKAWRFKAVELPEPKFAPPNQTGTQVF
jgi:hypothetical protein